MRLMSRKEYPQMPGPAESPTPPPPEENPKPAPESDASASADQGHTGHETAAQLQGDLADARNNGDKTPAGSTLKKLAKRAYAGAKSLITRKKPISNSPADAQPPSNETSPSAPDTPATTDTSTTPELKTVVSDGSGTDTSKSTTVNPAEDASVQEKSVLENISADDVRGGDAPDSGQASTGAEVSGQESKEDENKNGEESTDSEADGKENGEPEKTPEQRIQDAKDKLTSLNPYINFDSPEMQQLLAEALTDPDKLTKFESIVEKTNERVQSVIEIAEKQLTSADIANVTSHELTSLLETLKAVEPSVKADSAEGKRLHWTIMILLALALGVAMIPTGVGKVAGAMAQQR